MAGAPLINSYVTDPSYYNIELITRRNSFPFPFEELFRGILRSLLQNQFRRKTIMYQELFIVQGHEEAR